MNKELLEKKNNSGFIEAVGTRSGFHFYVDTALRRQRLRQYEANGGGEQQNNDNLDDNLDKSSNDDGTAQEEEKEDAIFEEAARAMVMIKHQDAADDEGNKIEERSNDENNPNSRANIKSTKQEYPLTTLSTRNSKRKKRAIQFSVEDNNDTNGSDEENDYDDMCKQLDSHKLTPIRKSSPYRKIITYGTFSPTELSTVLTGMRSASDFSDQNSHDDTSTLESVDGMKQVEKEEDDEEEDDPQDEDSHSEGDSDTKYRRQRRQSYGEEFTPVKPKILYRYDQSEDEEEYEDENKEKDRVGYGNEDEDEEVPGDEAPEVEVEEEEEREEGEEDGVDSDGSNDEEDKIEDRNERVFQPSTTKASSETARPDPPGQCRIRPEQRRLDPSSRNDCEETSVDSSDISQTYKTSFSDEHSLAPSNDESDSLPGDATDSENHGRSALKENITKESFKKEEDDCKDIPSDQSDNMPPKEGEDEGEHRKMRQSVERSCDVPREIVCPTSSSTQEFKDRSGTSTGRKKSQREQEENRRKAKHPRSEYSSDDEEDGHASAKKSRKPGKDDDDDDHDETSAPDQALVRKRRNRIPSDEALYKKKVSRKPFPKKKKNETKRKHVEKITDEEKDSDSDGTEASSVIRRNKKKQSKRRTAPAEKDKVDTLIHKTKKKKSKHVEKTFPPQGIQAGPQEFIVIPVTDLKPPVRAEERGLRRSQRARVAPLAFWKNERIVYGPNDFDECLYESVTNMPIPTAIAKAQPLSYKPRKSTSRRPLASSKGEKRNMLSSKSTKSFDSNRLRKKYTIMDGCEAILWDDAIEQERNQKIIGRQESMCLRPLPTSQKSAPKGKPIPLAAQAFNESYQEKGDISYPGHIMGCLILPPKSIKQAEAVGACAQTFTVVSTQESSVEISIGSLDEDAGQLDPSTTSRFLVSRGDMFHVPRGNAYRLENHSKCVESYLTWTIVIPY